MENRYFDVLVDCAKLDPEDTLCITNRGPEATTIHAPTAAYGIPGRGDADAEQPRVGKQARARPARHTPALGQRYFQCAHGERRRSNLLFCENETNKSHLLFGTNASPYVKDGVNDFVVHGDESAANREGGKMAAHFSPRRSSQENHG